MWEDGGGELSKEKEINLHILLQEIKPHYKYRVYHSWAN